MIVPWVVTTSDNYIHLMPHFAWSFNKHIGTYKVDVLCFEKPDKLPSNFTVISMGKQAEFGYNFTDPMIPYFEQFKSKFFIHLLEDYFIGKPMNEHLLSNIFHYCEKNNIRPSKIDLSTIMGKYAHHMVDNNIFIVDQGVPYRSSLQASLWRTEYWKKLLVRGRSPWKFERAGSLECINDGAVIFGTTIKILGYHNASHKGRMGLKKDDSNISTINNVLDVISVPYEINGVDEDKL